jgi:Zn-dependent M16 (insulinase) family peptidase
VTAPHLCAQWEDALRSFKTKLASGQDVFGPLIRKHLLANQHRVTALLLPDPALAARTEESEKQRLEAVRSGMKPEQVGRSALCCVTCWIVFCYVTGCAVIWGGLWIVDVW